MLDIDKIRGGRSKLASHLNVNTPSFIEQEKSKFPNIKIQQIPKLKPETSKLSKIQEKILTTQSDDNFEEWEVSSFSSTYRSSMIPGEMYVSVTTLENNISEEQ